MKKCEVIENFTLNEFDKLKNIKRKSKDNDVKGQLYVEDMFECDDKMANYLLGDNPIKKQVVKIIEDSKTNVYKNEEICYNKSNKKRDKKKEVE